MWLQVTGNGGILSGLKASKLSDTKWGHMGFPMSGIFALIVTYAICRSTWIKFTAYY